MIAGLSLVSYFPT